MNLAKIINFHTERNYIIYVYIYHRKFYCRLKRRKEEKALEINNNVSAYNK